MPFLIVSFVPPRLLFRSLLFSCVVLLGCGGGGDGGAPEPEGRTSAVSPACEGCGAVSPDTYSGSGLGVWSHRNDGVVDTDVPVYITGVGGRDVSLVFTRDTTTTSVASTGAVAATPAPAVRSLAEGPAPAIGTPRTWRHNDNSDRSTRLAGSRLARDGTRVDLWVEEGQAGDGKVSAAIVESLLSAYADTLHDALIELGGPLWGPHVYDGGMLPDEPRPVDIVLLDFKASGNQPRAYFWARNNYLKAFAPDSNEALAVFLDAGSTYLSARGLAWARSNLAHEMLHLQNFYRRQVSSAFRDTYPVWLEEMTAMVFEDIVTARLGGTYNSLRDGRLPSYLAGNANCAWMDFTAVEGGCDPYAATGLFGAYLLRQFGVAWFSDVLHRGGNDGITVVEGAMHAVAPSSDFATAYRRFAASVSSLVQSASAPPGYGFPARQDARWGLVTIEPRDMARYRMVPASLPATIAEWGSTVLKRQPDRGVYSDLVRVPPGLTLTVVVQ
jgi:hypothetical protein